MSKDLKEVREFIRNIRKTRILMYPCTENVKHDRVILWNILHNH